jgi:hypothetical protein
MVGFLRDVYVDAESRKLFQPKLAQRGIYRLYAIDWICTKS